MEFSSNLPIYIQIMNLIKTKIVSGEINGGEKLPSVRDFSKELKVNPNTIQRVYQELEREELVITQRGMGTFATNELHIIEKLKQSMATEVINRFLTEMENLGFESNEIKTMISKRFDKGEIE